MGKTQAAEARKNEAAAKADFDKQVEESGKQAAQPCEWMFGDAGMGALGRALAHYNPARWSGSVTCDTAISQLQDALKHAATDGHERPIVLKIPPGVSTPEQKFPSTTEA